MPDDKTLKEAGKQLAEFRKRKEFSNFLADRKHNMPKTVYDKPTPEKPPGKRGR